MENDRRWFSGTTLAFMAVILLPFFNFDIGVVNAISWSFQSNTLPTIFSIMLVLFLVMQITCAWYAAMICDWALIACNKRNWLQLKLSTCLIIMVAVSLLVGLNVNTYGYQHGYRSLAATMLDAFIGASVPIFFAFWVWMFVWIARATREHGPELWRRKADLTPELKVRIIGGIPLFLLVLLPVVNAICVEHLRYLWLRIDLPLPSAAMLRLADFVYKYPISVLLFAFIAFWFYVEWVSRDRKRIFWFNIVILGLLLFGLLLLAASIVLPMFKTQCILRGTRVKTPNGEQPIESLKNGDEVLSRSASGEIAVSTVTDIRSAEVDEHLILILDGGIELSCTGEHPIAVGDQWIRAKLLRVGDEVTCLDQIQRLVEIRTVKERVVVYDITVEPHHNFFAAGVLVHNKIPKK